MGTCKSSQSPHLKVRRQFHQSEVINSRILFVFPHILKCLISLQEARQILFCVDVSNQKKTLIKEPDKEICGSKRI